MLKEFKAFAMRGNVIDLAVGVIIGGAFGKITTSLVNDIVMPPIGKLLGNIDFKGLTLIIQDAVMDGETVVQPEIAIRYGAFINTILDFLIIAFCVFIVIRQINKLKKKEEEAPEPAPVEPEPTKEELLLSEIRDQLVKMNNK